MKKFLLFSALFLMGVTLLAQAAEFAVTVTTPGTLEDKGEAARVRDFGDGNGARKGVVLYYDVQNEWKTVKFTVAAEKVSIMARASKGGRYECKSLKVNGEEKLTAPVILERVPGKHPASYGGKADNGKFVVTVEVRKIESAE